MKAIFDEELEGYSFWENEGVNVSRGSDSDNYDLAIISKKVFEQINKQNWEENEKEPTKQEIISKAIQKIYSIR